MGTVRSRLSQARAKLSEALLATSASAHDDIHALTRASRAEAVETLAAAERGEFREVLEERWSPDVRLLGGRGEQGGRMTLLRGWECDMEAGVRQHFADAVTSRDITIWEMDMSNPPDDPKHCPPSVIWLMTYKEGMVHRLRLFHPAT